jgi:hypothetical protein
MRTLLLRFYKSPFILLLFSLVFFYDFYNQLGWQRWVWLGFACLYSVWFWGALRRRYGEMGG